jgi:hypothetical protein
MTQPLTAQQLDDIEARANAASKGPWTLAYTYCDCSEDCGHGLYVSRIDTGSGPATELCDLPRAEWELMVHARADVDALLATVRHLQKQRKFLLTQLAKRDAETGRGDEALRKFLAAHPDETVETPAAAEACGKCRTPFDPDDTRFDGHAQHKLTPYCRRCVDACHDTEIADHRCVICA